MRRGKGNDLCVYFEEILHKQVIFSLSFSFFPVYVIYIAYKCNAFVGIGLSAKVVGELMASFVPNLLIFSSTLIMTILLTVFGNRGKSSFDMDVRDVALDKAATIMQLVAGCMFSVSVILPIETNDAWRYLFLLLYWLLFIASAIIFEMVKEELKEGKWLEILRRG